MQMTLMLATTWLFRAFAVWYAVGSFFPDFGLTFPQSVALVMVGSCFILDFPQKLRVSDLENDSDNRELQNAQIGLNVFVLYGSSAVVILYTFVWRMFSG